MKRAEVIVRLKAFLEVEGLLLYRPAKGKVYPISSLDSLSYREGTKILFTDSQGLLRGSPDPTLIHHKDGTVKFNHSRCFYARIADEEGLCFAPWFIDRHKWESALVAAGYSNKLVFKFTSIDCKQWWTGENVVEVA